MIPRIGVIFVVKIAIKSEGNPHDWTAIAELLLHMCEVSWEYCNIVRVMGHKGSMKWDILLKEIVGYNPTKDTYNYIPAI